MLVFIVPLQSPRVSSNWERVSAVCERTMRSICGQTSQNFRVYLVCNTAPQLSFAHPAIRIVEDDFEIPERNTAACMFDKHQKIKRGLIAARGDAPCHVMIADADDCVHSGLAQWCDRHPNDAGWYFPKGYMYTAGSGWVHRLPGFDLICGTSAIVKCGEVDFPGAMSDPKSDFFLVDVGHFEFRYPEKIQGRRLKPLPFPGAVYVTDTGDNYTGASLRRWDGWKMFVRRLVTARPLTSRIRRTFGLYELA
jgi:hypothetical protein